MRSGSTSPDSKKLPAATAGAILLVALAVVPARADVIRTATSVTYSGAIDNSAGPVSVEATLSIDPSLPDYLNLLLVNTSTTPTPNPAGLLTSFYFGIYSGTTSGSAPTLTYLSGSGQVYMASRFGPDIPGVWIPPSVSGSAGLFVSSTTGLPGELSNLKATMDGDYTWELRQNLALVASEPPLNFGIGTVGNASLWPNNFNGDIVDGNDFGIYVGDATTQSMQSVGLVVSGSAWFRFSGFSDYTIANVPDHAVFGLGSGPDLIITVPEPGSMALAAIGAIAALGCRLRRSWTKPAWPSISRGAPLALGRPRRERLGVPGAPLKLPTVSIVGSPGCLTGLLRHRSLVRSAARSTAATIAVVIVIIWFLATPPARADVVWDFQFTSGTLASMWEGPGTEIAATGARGP